MEGCPESFEQEKPHPTVQEIAAAMPFQCKPSAITTRPRPRRFAFVLTSSLLLAVAQPLLAHLFDEEIAFDVFFSLLVMAVILFVFEQREHRRTALTIGLVAMAGIWLGLSFPGGGGTLIIVVAYLAAAGVFVFALCRVLSAIFVKEASWDALFGAVCGYLLLGVVWTVLYRAVETASPGSFSIPSQQGVGSSMSALGYFSFITLATVGYGDVVPVTPIARTLAWIEALAGQLYLAVLVAGLVGIKVSQAMKE